MGSNQSRQTSEPASDRAILLVVAAYAAAFVAFGLAVDGPVEVARGLFAIVTSRDAQRRPRRLQAAPLQPAAAWIDEYRKFWEGSFDRMGDYLKELHRKEKKHARKR